jgi:restriction system protein
MSDIDNSRKSEKSSSATDKCPKCGTISYQGGYCFGCGTYRPSKHTKTTDLETLDVSDFITRSFGTRLTDLEYTEEQVDEFLHLMKMHEKHSARKKGGKWRSVVVFDERNTSEASLLVQGVIQPYGSTEEGALVRALVVPWRTIVGLLRKDWTQAFKIPPRIWEEMIAAAFEQDGYDEVILTPRSGDHGRDVVAIKRGIGCIRIIDSVKAYAPGHLVRHDDVRALAGVLHGDLKASKGIVTTTSDFAPGIITDPYLAPLMPYRLELMNGPKLREWLSKLAK